MHEWGTFTSFAGSDGVNLEFRPLVDSDLPAFVYSPASRFEFTKRSIFARQRMETPVTYFYSDVERDVNVSVAFRQGRLTEFYPPPLTHQSKLAADQKTLLRNESTGGKSMSFRSGFSRRESRIRKWRGRSIATSRWGWCRGLMN